MQPGTPSRFPAVSRAILCPGRKCFVFNRLKNFGKSAFWGLTRLAVKRKVSFMVTRYVVARDHKTNLNTPREYRGLSEGGLFTEWQFSSMQATRYRRKEAAAEVKRLQTLYGSDHEIFFYKD
jgi:hypothetical protein